YDDGGGADAALLDGAPTADGSAHDASNDTSADGTVADSGADASDAAARDAATRDASVGPNILGSAASFAVFSGATVTNATATVTTITGDLGTYPGTTAIGPTPPVVVGAEHLGDLTAKAAAADIQLAYDQLIPGNLACGTTLTGLDLGGMTLVPGVYCFSSTAGLTGTLTLDAQNNPKARWVFQVGSALTTASGSHVVVINGTAGQACNAYWQISSSATLGTSSIFGGTILAQAAVTVTTGTSILGRTFGMTANVSTDTNVITIAGCAPNDLPIVDAGLPDAADAGIADASDGG
ncbi:MAG: ice-binding family protein, partial [Polyangiaceae bacterium]